jgi:hypothetical protein
MTTTDICIPKRIRLVKACRDHLYSEVKRTLATDKEIRSLKFMDKKISDWYESQAGATELCSTCYPGNCICEENNRNRLKQLSNG